jgi:hypothetical protein
VHSLWFIVQGLLFRVWKYIRDISRNRPPSSCRETEQGLRVEGKAASEQGLRVEGKAASEQGLRVEGKAASEQGLRVEGKAASEQGLRVEGKAASHIPCLECKTMTTIALPS